MKTKKSILMLVLLGMVFTFSCKASENDDVHEAVYNLKDHISSLFKVFPWEDIVEPQECCTVTLSFRVNENSSLEDIQVEGDNNELVHYARVILSDHKIITDDVLRGMKYKLQIKFENKG